MGAGPQIPLFALASPGADAAWQAVNDGVMGGVSDGGFGITERQTLEFYGKLPLERFEATSFGRVLPGVGPVDPRSVTSIGFLLAEKTPGPFALEVAWINVLRGPGR